MEELSARIQEKTSRGEIPDTTEYEALYKAILPTTLHGQDHDATKRIFHRLTGLHAFYVQAYFGDRDQTPSFYISQR
eukprot:SAG22_NODE_13889_length_392_cov_0.385666_1_plen_76_part_01